MLKLQLIFRIIVNVPSKTIIFDSWKLIFYKKNSTYMLKK